MRQWCCNPGMAALLNGTMTPIIHITACVELGHKIEVFLTKWYLWLPIVVNLKVVFYKKNMKVKLIINIVQVKEFRNSEH